MKIKILSVAISLIVLSFVSSNAKADLVLDGSSFKSSSENVSETTTRSTTNRSTTSRSKDATIIRSRQTSQVSQTGQVLQTGGDYSTHPVSKVLTEKGARPTYIKNSGWANDMPLSVALRQIVPIDFELQENGILLQDSVSWSGDKPWTDTLSQVAFENGFVAHIDWSNKNVSLAPASFVVNESFQETVYERPSVERTIVKVVNQPSYNQDPSKRVYDEKATVRVDMSDVDRSSYSSTVTTQVLAPMPSSWVLNPEFTLRENVEIWAKKAGWNVVWEASDYPIIATTNFGSGSFTDQAGPLARLIAAYETSEQPLVAQLTTLDKVVYVRNKYFERNQVMGTSQKELSPTMFDYKDGAANNNPDTSLGTK